MASFQTQIVAQPDKVDFRIKRSLPFSLEKVYRAYSEPELYSQWYMPGMIILKMDCKTEGAFCHTHLMADNKTYGFRGVYHEVLPQQRIVRTSEFFGLPQKLMPNIEITDFIKIDNDNTEVNIHTICPSVEVRNAMIQHGMKEALTTQDGDLANVLNTM